MTSQRPPFSYFNWWQNLVYQWCVYLDGITNEALTWAAAQVFSVKATFSAGATISVAPSAATDVARKFEVDAEATARANADALKANDNAVVHLTGAEAVAGVKTFSSSPSVPTPNAAGDAASKGYVDGKFPALAWGSLGTPSTGYANSAGTGQTPGYWKDASGVVHLKGAVLCNSGTAGNAIFPAGALPAGCRPAGMRFFAIAGSQSGSYATWLQVGTDGSLTLQPPGLNTNYYYLDGISFVAEA